MANFTLAIDRRFKREGEQNADFIRCVAFGKLGEHVEKYYRKGMKTILDGRIQTRNYENRDGQRVYVTEVVVENMEFAESKAASQNNTKNGYQPAVTTGNRQQKQYNQASLDGFMDLPDGFDEELPFN